MKTKSCFFCLAFLTMFLGKNALGDDQNRLEEYLGICVPYCDAGNEPYVPRRYRDSLADSRDFFEQSNWTTNQFIEGMMFVMTNNVQEGNWTNASKRTVARMAAWKLREIDSPAITNFFRQFNDTDNTSKLKNSTIPGMFYYTNLESEILDYLRTLCVRTNVYDDVSFFVALRMRETLSTMQPELQPAATNRVAQYMYFSIRHTTQQLISQDTLLAEFLPSYANSVQRLDAMRYVQSTTTNLRTRVLAQQEVDRLSAIPTNQLNDISWIAEAVNGGN